MPLSFRSDPQLREKIFYFTTVDSTMDTARHLAQTRASHLDCVVAEHQTRGRGRLNRHWDSAQGGLWFTLILTPQTPPPLAYLYNFAASLCLADVLQQMYHLDVRVKWPNDLLLEGRKLSGLLSEMQLRADRIRFLLIGIGLNVNNIPDTESYPAISLCQALGKPVCRREILSRFLMRFEAGIQNPDPSRIMSAWKMKTATLGSRVRVETRDQVYEGMAVDVMDTGTLVLRDDRDAIHQIVYGDCFHTDPFSGSITTLP